MKSLDELGQVISTDVLVIGGGLSGVMAAIKAKENPVNVLVVDKGGIGWAGQMPLTGGHSMFLQPDKVEEWFEWAVDAGEYLNDQDWTYAVGSDNYKCVMETADWGLPWLRTADGEVAVVQLLKYYTSTRYEPAKFMAKLKQVAVKRGVRTLDKVYVLDLLRQDSRTVGAIGFGLVDGKTYIVKAKSTIIANGDCMSQANRLFVCNCGEGVTMAYRAGAQLRNADFGGEYGFGFKAGDLFRRMPLYLFYENALGERFIEKYHPELAAGLKRGEEKEDFHKIADAIRKEVEAGRGPIYFDFRKLSPQDMDVALRLERDFASEFNMVGRGNLMKFLRDRCGLDPAKERLEIILQHTNIGGPIRVGLDCRTTVEGLWSTGDACYLGSSWAGARASGSFPGWGVPFAMVSGFRGGRDAGEYAATSGEIEVNHGEVSQLRESMLAPLNREGTIETNEVVYQVQEATVPIKYNLCREEGKLKEALGKIDRAKQQLTKIGAKNHHELMQYHQAESMVSCAALALKAELMREESRGTHRREDYPNRDDKNWLKWIIIQQEAGKDKFFAEPVPLEKYRLKPPPA